MKSVWKLSWILVLSTGIAPAVGAQAEKGEAKVEKAAQSTKYAVVQVGRDISVVESSSVAGMREKIANENKAAADAWSKAKDAATAAKKPFTERRPMTKTLKVIADQLSKEEADKARAAAVAKAAKAGGPKSTTKPKKTTDATTTKHKK